MNSRVGILAIDPGTTSGADCGTWSLEGGVIEAVSGWSGVNRELVGGIPEQAQIALGMWRGLTCSQRYLVLELYQQRPTAHIVPGYGLDPVKVAWYLMGLFEGKGELMNVIWVTPSQAKSHVTDVRLKEWGAWIPGSLHRRDAKRLAITARNRLASIPRK